MGDLLNSLDKCKRSRLYIQLFYTEILVHNNEKLIEMSEDYGQQINVLIALCTASAHMELAETFWKCARNIMIKTSK